ncbi:hypothetical protein CHS0354_041207, partial [Potamilus streckersoni]
MKHITDTTLHGRTRKGPSSTSQTQRYTEGQGKVHQAHQRHNSIVKNKKRST